MVTVLEIAGVKLPSVAVSVYVPALLMWHPTNVASPEIAASGFTEQVNVAPPAVVSAKVTELVFVVTVFPPASLIATAG